MSLFYKMPQLDTCSQLFPQLWFYHEQKLQLTSIKTSFKPVFQDAPERYLFPVLPQFVQAFTQFLSMPDSLTSDCGLKMEILKVGVGGVST